MNNSDMFDFVPGKIISKSQYELKYKATVCGMEMICSL